MTELTLNAIMGEDMTIECEGLDDNHVKVSVLDENEELVHEEETHIYAWESLVYFAKQILAVDARLTQGKQ